MRRLGKWVEHDHPRGKDGKFTSGGGGVGSSAPSWSSGWKSGSAAYTPKHRKPDTESHAPNAAVSKASVSKVAEQPSRTKVQDKARSEPTKTATKATAKPSWPKPAKKTNAGATATPKPRTASKPPSKSPTKPKLGRKVGEDSKDNVLREGDTVRITHGANEGKTGTVTGKGKYGAVRVTVDGQESDMSPANIRSVDAAKAPQQAVDASRTPASRTTKKPKSAAGNTNSGTSATTGPAEKDDPKQVTGGQTVDVQKLYGNRLRVRDDQIGKEHVENFAKIPAPFHGVLAGHIDRIDFGEGSVVDYIPELGGLQPRGNDVRGSFHKVTGVYVGERRHLVASGSENLRGGSAAVANHEAGHGIDDALGTPSSKPEFTKIHADAVAAGVNPYYSQPGNAGREEMWAEAFAAWSALRNESPRLRNMRMGFTLGMNLTDALTFGQRLSDYYENLLSSLEH